MPNMGGEYAPQSLLSQPPAPTASPVNARLEGQSRDVLPATTSGRPVLPAPHRADQQHADRSSHTARAAMLGQFKCRVLSAMTARAP